MDLSVKTHHDRSTAQRSVPMKCLALGMPRTGTNSLRDALKILGLNECYHQVTLIQNPEDGVLWKKALESRGTGDAFGRVEWDALLGHCQAVCDIPAAHFPVELMQAYPEAKVILTTRDVDKWHTSISQTIEKRYQNRLVYALSFVDKVTSLWASVFYLGWNEMFRGNFEQNWEEVYNTHNENVRRHAEPERLLEYHVSQGWEPLCEFLDLPIPDQPFPSGNDQEDFHVACNALDRDRVTSVLGKATVCVLCIGVAFGAYQRAMR